MRRSRSTTPSAQIPPGDTPACTLSWQRGGQLLQPPQLLGWGGGQGKGWGEAQGQGSSWPLWAPGLCRALSVAPHKEAERERRSPPSTVGWAFRVSQRARWTCRSRWDGIPR